VIGHLKARLKRWINARIAEELDARIAGMDAQTVRRPGSQSAPPSALFSIQKDTREFETLGPPSEYKKDYPGFMDILESKPGIDAALARDTSPLPVTADREGYGDDQHFRYWLGGLRDYLMIRQLLRSKCKVDLTGRVFDLGCASGRVVRHMAAQEPGLEVWGADINNRHVEWMRRYLPGNIKVFQCTTLPSLPIEDNSMSLVSAFSVFTHIDEFDLAWLSEIRRILRPGAVAYLTVHSDRTWANMKPDDKIYRALLDGNDWIAEYDVTEKFLSGPMPREKTVFTYNSAANYNTNVFLSEKYIRQSWGRLFEVIDIVPEAHAYQDVVLLRKHS